MNSDLTVIAHIKSGFKTKFGIPRQSGLAESTKAQIVFVKPFNNPDFIRGLEGYSHIWLLWQFSECVSEGYTPTVRPPRLGGNKRMGVFATRSPFRPNSIGLSSVKIERIDYTPSGPVITVLGADLMDGTPIFDIKPYLPFTDSHPEATFGFSQEKFNNNLQVEFSKTARELLPQHLILQLENILSQDPRPSYQDDTERVYGMEFYEYEIKFTVEDTLLNVIEIKKAVR